MTDIPTTEFPADDVLKIAWDQIATGDCPQHQQLPGTMGAVAAVQMEGAWGSATAVLQGSNDGTNWVTLKDTAGSDISMTADGMAELSTACLYVRPSISGGTGDDINVTLVCRG